MLKKISEQEGVVEITGEDDTGSWAASHEHMRHDDEKNYPIAEQHYSYQLQKALQWVSKL